MLRRAGPRSRNHAGWFALFVVLVTAVTLAILGFGLTTYAPRERATTLASWETRLAATADDRVAAVERWVQVGVAISRAVASYPTARYAAEGRTGPPFPFPSEAGPVRHLEALLRDFIVDSDYRAAFVLDRTGAVLASASEGVVAGDAAIVAAARGAIADAVAVAAVVRTAGEREVVVFAYPLLAASGEALGCAAIVADPEAWLLPFLAHEPGGSRTAETVLVHREGSLAVFLSRPRHAAAGAMPLRRPLDSPGFTAAAALAGKRSFGEFTDYRGVPVYAVTRSVRGTDWGLVAKVDREEALAPYLDEVRDFGAVLLGGYLAVLLAGFGLWRGLGARADRALAASEARFALLRDHANDAIMVLDRNGTIADVNARATDLYGRSREQLLGRHVSELRPEPARKDLDAAFASVLSSGSVVLETTHLAAGGVEIPVEVSACVAEIDGEPVVLSIVRDVRERHAAAARIHELNRLLRTISDINQLIVREKDRDRLVAEVCRIIVSHRDFSLAWIGFARPPSGELEVRAAEGAAVRYLDHIVVRCDESPEGRGPAGTAIREARTVVVDDLGADESFAPWREQAAAAGLVSVVSVPVAVAGEAVGVLNVYGSRPGLFDAQVCGLLEEVAADLGFALGSLHHEAALRESEARYRLLAENSNDVIFLWRLLPSPHFEYLSPAALALTGHDPQEFVADPDLYLRIVHHEDQSTVRRILAGNFDPARSSTVRLIHREGTVVWTEQRCALVADEGGRTVAVEGNVRDVTAQRRVEEQLLQAQKMEGVGRLAGGVAHDFNNLLQAMMGVSQLLRADQSSQGAISAAAAELDTYVQRGADLARQLLLFSRQTVLRREKVDLNDIVQSAAGMLRRLVRENIRFRLEPDEALLPVEADRGQLEQVLVNLVVNAIDAMPDGGSLTLRTGREDEDWVWFEVSDTGPGIEAAVRLQIFEPFFTTKAEGKGTGLGLSVVHGVVSQHHGHVEVDSEPGRGATFRVVLPHRGSGVWRSASAPQDAPQLPESRSGRILVVEDEPSVRLLFSRLLGRLGHHVTVAGSVAEARSAAGSGDFDVLITDAILPDGNGLEVARELRGLEPGLRVILMSGYAGVEVGGGDLAREGITFLQKPVDMDTLARAVHAALESD